MLQRDVVWHREYSQYFKNNFKWCATIKNCESQCCILETNIILYISQLYLN